MYKLFENVFKYPSPADKSAPSPSGGEGFGLPRHWCHKILGTDCASRPRMTGGRGTNPLGRSMIEMLGVLAIVGVLSVGGIAGYSKAMEKFKVNKTLEQYSYLVAGMLGNVNEFKKLKCNYWEMNWQECGLRDYVLAANLVPADWHSNNVRNQLIDSDGNMVNVFSRGGNLVMDFHIGGFTNNDDGTGFTPYFPVKLCRALMSDLAQPLHSVVEYVMVYKSGTNYKTFYGDAYCGDGKKCLNDITLTEINDECNSCQGSEQSCTVTLEF